MNETTYLAALDDLAAIANKRKAPELWFLLHAEALLVPAVIAPWDWDIQLCRLLLASYIKPP